MASQGKLNRTLSPNFSRLTEEDAPGEKRTLSYLEEDSLAERSVRRPSKSRRSARHETSSDQNSTRNSTPFQGLENRSTYPSTHVHQSKRKSGSSQPLKVPRDQTDDTSQQIPSPSDSNAQKRKTRVRRRYNKYETMPRGEELLRRLGWLEEHHEMATANDIRDEIIAAADPEVKGTLNEKTVLNAVRKEIASAINNYLGKDTEYAKAFLAWRNKAKGKQDLVGKLSGLKGAGFRAKKPKLPSFGQRGKKKCKRPVKKPREKTTMVGNEERERGTNKNGKDDDHENQEQDDEPQDQPKTEGQTGVVDKQEMEERDSEGSRDGEETEKQRNFKGEAEETETELSVDPLQEVSSKSSITEDDLERWNWLGMEQDEGKERVRLPYSEASEEDLNTPSDQELKEMFYGASGAL